jgi:alpha-N-acetylglucosamine transferase
MKVLRAPSDLFLDIHDQVLKDAHEKFYRQQNILVPKLDVATITNQEIAFIRKEANLDLVPQLFIYCIDQTSECSDNPDFKLQEDLIGLSVFMPKPILDPHVVVHKKSTVMYSIDKHNQLKMTLKKSKEK